MYSLTYAELNSFIPDLEVSANDTDVANTTDSVIIKNVAYTTAEDTTQNGVYKEVPARTDKLIIMFLGSAYIALRNLSVFVVDAVFMHLKRAEVQAETISLVPRFYHAILDRERFALAP